MTGARLDEGALRALVPRVLAGLVRRGEDFDAAEDALQEALLEALRVWPDSRRRMPRAWLAAVADAAARRRAPQRGRAARAARRRARRAAAAGGGPTTGDDTLFLLFCCCHPDLAPASQVALTLRAVGGLTTREIADAFYVPEATMAQRISRAKRTLRGQRLDQPGDLAVVLRVLYLIYSAGHAGRVDLAAEAIRLTRAAHARDAGARSARPARADAAQPRPAPRALRRRRAGSSRSTARTAARWDTREIAEGVRVLQSALALRTSGPLPDRGRDRRPARRRGARRGDRLAADPGLVRRPRRR